MLHIIDADRSNPPEHIALKQCSMCKKSTAFGDRCGGCGAIKQALMLLQRREEREDKEKGGNSK